VGLVLRSASARLDVRQASACDLQRFLAFSQTTKGGFHRTPPLSMRASVPQSALYVIMACHAAVLRLIRPSRSSVRRSCGPLKRQNPPRSLLLLFARVLG
jgi:hypothetical protein